MNMGYLNAMAQGVANAYFAAHNLKLQGFRDKLPEICRLGLLHSKDSSATVVEAATKLLTALRDAGVAVETEALKESAKPSGPVSAAPMPPRPQVRGANSADWALFEKIAIDEGGPMCARLVQKAREQFGDKTPKQLLEHFGSELGTDLARQIFSRYNRS